MNNFFVLALIITTLVFNGCTRSNNEINFILACAEGDIEYVRERITDLNTINYISIKGDTPLNAAIISGNLELVKFLVKNGAKLNFLDLNGKAPLDVALANNNLEILNYIQENLRE